MYLSTLYSKFRREFYKGFSRLGLMHARVNHNGIEILIPTFNGLGSGHLVERDPWMITCLRAFLNSKPGMVIDVGVNIGFYLLRLKLIDDGREYVGFEPNAACNHYTQKLITANKFSDARIFPFALSDKQELRNFYTVREGDKMGSLLPSARKEKKGKIITSLLTMVGDDLVEFLNPDEISVIKVDVEGAELGVLAGLQKTIKKYKPYIYCEILRFPEPAAPDYSNSLLRAQNVLELTNSLGYSIYGLDDTEGRLYKIDDVEDFGAPYLTDYILMEAAEAASIQAKLTQCKLESSKQ